MGPYSLLTPAGGYDGIIPTGGFNPLENEGAFCGIFGWQEEVFDITPFVGDTIHIMWSFGVDTWTTWDQGWNVDEADEMNRAALVKDREGDYPEAGGPLLVRQGRIKAARGQYDR